MVDPGICKGIEGLNLRFFQTFGLSWGGCLSRDMQGISTFRI